LKNTKLSAEQLGDQRSALLAVKIEDEEVECG